MCTPHATSIIAKRRIFFLSFCGIVFLFLSFFLFSLSSLFSLFSNTCNTQENFYGKSIEVADRDLVESNADVILRGAREGNVAFLVVGDPFG